MKYRLDRALRILRLLQSNRRYDPIGLTEALQVNRRTIYRDLALLREMGIDIVYDHAENNYVIKKLGDSDQHGVGPDKLRELLGRAMTDERQDTSVENIVRHVALILAGASPESIAQESKDRALIRRPGETGPTINVLDGQVNFTDQTDDRVQQDIVDPDSADKESVSTLAHDDRGTVASVGQAGSPSRFDLPTDWQFTRDSLSLLRQAVDDGSIIETCENNPADLGSANQTSLRMLPTEFVVSRDEVVVTGLDARGKLIRSPSHSIRLMGLGYHDRNAPRQSRSMK